jgi:hypothetical protein
MAFRMTSVSLPVELGGVLPVCLLAEALTLANGSNGMISSSTNSVLMKVLRVK